MKEIKLPNRDGADLRLVETDEPFIWKLTVDSQHSYCLEHMRMIGSYTLVNNKPVWSEIEAVDPAGGPFLSVGDKFERGKYEIVQILGSTNFIIRERDNNSENNLK